MRAHILAAVVAILAIGGCSRTDSGDVVVKRPTSVDIKTRPETLRVPSFRTKKDTVSAPVVGTQQETIVVKKPVVGKRKKVITVPQVQRP
jgi:hypothetical protein